jgi:hypothetical protein
MLYQALFEVQLGNTMFSVFILPLSTVSEYILSKCDLPYPIKRLETNMKKLLPMLSLAAVSMSMAAFAQAAEVESFWSQSAFAASQGLVAAPTQSTDPLNPGSNVYRFSSFTTTDFKTTDGKAVRIFAPVGATGQLPMVAFGAGKSLGDPKNYQAMFEHMVKKGIVVVNIRFEGGFFDTDFVKFAGHFNNAVKQTLARTALADPAQVYYVGHSLGSQVSVIAAALATTVDTTNAFVDPKGMVLMSYDNSRGPSNGGDLNNPAVGYAAKVGAGVRAMILEMEDDTIAGPSKTYAQSLYNKMPLSKKQWIRVKGKTFGSTYGLAADHNTPLTGGGAPLGIGGPAVISSLDWNMVWKSVAGLPLSGKSVDAANFITGSNLINAGKAADGMNLMHTLMGQNF